MARAAAELVGRHDFRAFRAADCERKTTERLVRRVALTTDADAPEALRIEVEATAFLKNMVRIIVGTLVEAGRASAAPRTSRRSCGAGTGPAPGRRRRRTASCSAAWTMASAPATERDQGRPSKLASA